MRVKHQVYLFNSGSFTDSVSSRPESSSLLCEVRDVGGFQVWEIQMLIIVVVVQNLVWKRWMVSIDISDDSTPVVEESTVGNQMTLP